MDNSPQQQKMVRAIGIVAGSGGHNAIPQILNGLPGGFSCPILIVWSMRPDLVAPFVAWLDGQCPLDVVAAEDGDVLEPGRVYVGSGHDFLTITNGRIRIEPGDLKLVKDTLFRSMARELGPGAIAVILTGMGSDGADGMKEVRDAGGYTIAQDEATSLVYGTPRFAVRRNAARESLPIGEIASRLLTLVESESTGL